MNDEIKLTRKGWDIVEEQCKNCIHWSYLYGCKCPEASDPEPYMDCIMLTTEEPTE